MFEEVFRITMSLNQFNDHVREDVQSQILAAVTLYVQVANSVSAGNCDRERLQKTKNNIISDVIYVYYKV